MANENYSFRYFSVSKREFLENFIKNEEAQHPADTLDDLKEDDPVRYQTLMDAKEELRILNQNEAKEEHRHSILEKEQDEQPSYQQGELFPQPQHSTLNLAPAIRPAPTQTVKQEIKGSTMLSPPKMRSIVNPYYENSHAGINWPHYENILSLFALETLVQRPPTRQQQTDIEELSEAIENVANKGYKRKHKLAHEVIKENKKVYLNFGKSVITTLSKNPQEAENCDLSAYHAEIRDTQNDFNAEQLQKTLQKSQKIFITLRNRYRDR